MNADDREFIRLAIKEATESIPEDGRVHPKVGAVVVKDGKILASAHRGEISGQHAEYCVLEEKLGDEPAVGATVYVTLEPCTERNSKEKVPCAKRLIEHKVARVSIGMLDPNPDISGKGQIMLSQAGVATELFPSELQTEVQALNREFIRLHSSQSGTSSVSEEFVRKNRERPLDDWYDVMKRIYANRNYGHDANSIFAHLVEVIGGLSSLASQKRVLETSPESLLPKALAWWMALLAKVKVKSVGNLIWAKFPYVCPYCHLCPHDADECSERKTQRVGLDWERLTLLAERNVEKRPNSLGEWQRMFAAIYPAHDGEGYGQTFARLTEEIGELAEALRVFEGHPRYFYNEAADLFAWLMHIQNLIEWKGAKPKTERGRVLEIAFCKAYPVASGANCRFANARQSRRQPSGESL